MLAGMLMGYPLQSLAQTFWIRLSGNRVILDARILGVEEESLIVIKDGKRTGVHIGEIETVRTIAESDILEGALLGAGIGAASGGLIGAIGKTERDDNWDAGTTALYVAVIGGIVGSVVASADNGGVSLELAGRTTAERKELLSEFLVRLGENPH